MIGRTFVSFCALVCVMALGAGLATDHVSAADRPDVIVITVDDLGAIDNRILERLPNIAALFIDDGLNFRQAYSETPLCCPGRASFLTGQHTRHHGVVENDARLLDPSHTIATSLHDAGYHTVMVGKYLNGAAQLTDHTPPGWDQVAMLNDWSVNQSSDWWVQDQPVTDGYFDRFIADTAATWLNAAPVNQPLFMWITPHAPHKSAGSVHDWEPDIEPRYVGDPRCTKIEPWDPPSYEFAGRPGGFPLDDICRSLLTVDDMVGQLRDIAHAQGRNPVWMLTSDNGMAWGAHGYLLKNVPAADQLPLYVSGPGVVDGKTQALVSNIDFAPTIADLAGTSMPQADGRSFVAVLQGADAARKAMLEDHPVGGPTGEGDVATGPWWAVRTPDWYLVVWNGVSLYDTNADPWEMQDVAAEHPDVVARLSGIYDRPLPPPTPTPGPPSASPTEPTAEPTGTIPPGETPFPDDTPGASATPSPGATAQPSPTYDVVSPPPDEEFFPPMDHPVRTPVTSAAAPGSALVSSAVPSASPGSDVATAPLGSGALTSGPSSVAVLGFYVAMLALAGIVGMFLGRRLRARLPADK